MKNGKRGREWKYNMPTEDEATEWAGGHFIADLTFEPASVGTGWPLRFQKKYPPTLNNVPLPQTHISQPRSAISQVTDCRYISPRGTQSLNKKRNGIFNASYILYKVIFCISLNIFLLWIDIINIYDFVFLRANNQDMFSWQLITCWSFVIWWQLVRGIKISRIFSYTIQSMWNNAIKTNTLFTRQAIFAECPCSACVKYANMHSPS